MSLNAAVQRNRQHSRRVLCSTVPAPLKASAKCITGGLTEKYTEEIAIEGLSSGPPAPLRPRQEIRGVSHEKNHLLPSLLLFPISSPLFCSSSCFLSSPLLTLTFPPMSSLSPSSLIIVLYLLSSFTSCVFFLPVPPPPPPPPPLALPFSPSGREINKWLLKGYHWFEKPDVSSPLWVTES